MRILFSIDPLSFLSDGTNLSLYKLTEGSKLHCMIKKESTPSGRTHSLEGSTTEKKQADNNSVDHLLYMALRRYFETDADTRKVVAAFKQVKKML